MIQTCKHGYTFSQTCFECNRIRIKGHTYQRLSNTSEDMEERNQRIIAFYKNVRSFSETARAFGMSRERMRQLVSKYCPDVLPVRSRRTYDPIQQKAKRKEYARIYYQTHKDIILRRSKAYQGERREQRKAYQAAWYQRNKERIREGIRKRPGYRGRKKVDTAHVIEVFKEYGSYTEAAKHLPITRQRIHQIVHKHAPTLSSLRSRIEDRSRMVCVYCHRSGDKYPMGNRNTCNSCYTFLKNPSKRFNTIEGFVAYRDARIQHKKDGVCIDCGVVVTEGHNRTMRCDRCYSRFNYNKNPQRHLENMKRWQRKNRAYLREYNRLRRKALI